VGRLGVVEVIEPVVSPEERELLHASAASLKSVLSQIS
jgi:malate/lactate dehydrogenase